MFQQPGMLNSACQRKLSRNTRGTEVEVSVDKAVQIGQKTYTANVIQRQPSLVSAPTAKRSRLTEWSTPQTSG